MFKLISPFGIAFTPRICRYLFHSLFVLCLLVALFCLMKRLNSCSLMIINTTPFLKSTVKKGISLTLDICHTNAGEFRFAFLKRWRSFRVGSKFELKFRAPFVCCTSQSTWHPFRPYFFTPFSLNEIVETDVKLLCILYVFVAFFLLYLFSFPSRWWPLLFSFVLVHWLCAVSNFCEILKTPSPATPTPSGFLNRFAVLENGNLICPHFIFEGSRGSAESKGSNTCVFYIWRS